MYKTFILLLSIFLVQATAAANAAHLELTQDKLRAIVNTSPSQDDKTPAFPTAQGAKIAGARLASASGYMLDRYWSLEIGEASLNTNIEKFRPFVTEKMLAQKSPYFNLNFTPLGEKSLFTPYIGGGVGLTYDEAHTPLKDVFQHDNMAFNGAIGFDLTPSGPLNFSVRYQQLWVKHPTKNLNTEFINLKASYSF